MQIQRSHVLMVALTGLLTFASSRADTPVPPKATPTIAKEQPPSQAQSKLNLKVPDVNRVLTPGERRAAIGPKDNEDTAETVEVQRQRDGGTIGAPKPPGGLASVFWAVAHPVQAWRIFFPLPPEQRGGDVAPRND